MRNFCDAYRHATNSIGPVVFNWIGNRHLGRSDQPGRSICWIFQSSCFDDRCFSLSYRRSEEIRSSSLVGNKTLRQCIDGAPCIAKNRRVAIGFVAISAEHGTRGDVHSNCFGLVPPQQGIAIKIADSRKLLRHSWRSLYLDWHQHNIGRSSTTDANL